MATNRGFRIEISSRYEGWWRYNVTLMCGLFDRGDRRIGFASAESRVADPGSGAERPPADYDPARRPALETGPCDHLQLYVYIIPHRLPDGNDIESARPFDVEIDIRSDGREILHQRRAVNQWSGASIEMRVGSEAPSCE